MRPFWKVVLSGLALLLVTGPLYSSPHPGQEKTAAEEGTRKAAEQGDATAQVALGEMYHKGRGVKQDFAEAARWYRTAAEQGNADAQFNLGILYEEGQGVKQDYAEALRWYRAAAEQALPAAQSFLAGMYASGKGVTRDYVEAHMWVGLAASIASGDAQKRYARTRDILAALMTPQQIAEAQQRVREWKPKSGKQNAPER
jgi:hypothetical protein